MARCDSEAIQNNKCQKDVEVQSTTEIKNMSSSPRNVTFTTELNLNSKYLTLNRNVKRVNNFRLP